MAIRGINYNIDINGIDPAVEQFGGTQAEHNATELTFTLSNSLKTALTGYISGTQPSYRFDIYDAEGNCIKTDSASLVSSGTIKSSVTLSLTEAASRFGGKITVYLIITKSTSGDTDMCLYSFPARIRFNTLPDGNAVDDDYRDNLTTLKDAAQQSADSAAASATNAHNSEENAEDYMERTESAKAALDNGATWIFSGGDANQPDPEVDVNLTVDQEFNISSTHAIANKVVKAAIDTAINTTIPGLIAAAIDTAINTTIQGLIAAAKSQAILAAHPVGSLYYSLENMTEEQANNSAYEKHPAQLFGGSWERITGKIIVAAGTHTAVTDSGDETHTFTIQESGGEYKHKLSVSEMPSHNHTVNYLWTTEASGKNNTINGSPNQDKEGAYSVITMDNGSDAAHNNMPPYTVAYCWKRTA